MATSINSLSKSHADKLLESLQHQRKQGLVCDFLVKAGKESFPVHRNVLAAFSGYFRTMFLHNTKESRDGFIDMASIDPEAARQCIEYMYTGKTGVTEKNAQHLLYASGLMQLDGLANLCFEYLKVRTTKQKNGVDEMQPTEPSKSKAGNARKLNCSKLTELAKRCVVNNFEELISTPTLPQMKFDDLKHCIEVSGIGCGAAWKAVTRWVGCGSVKPRPHVAHLIKFTAEAKNFPFSFLLNKVWKEPFIQESEMFQQPVIAKLLWDMDALRRNTTLSTYQTLLKAIGPFDYQRAKNAKGIIFDFIAANFDKVSQDGRFIIGATEDDLLSVFKRCPPSESTEKNKWFVLMKWLEGRKCEKGVFVKLLEQINFNILTSDFMKDTMNWDAQIMKSRGETDTVLNVVCEYMHRKIENVTSSEKVIPNTVVAKDIPHIVVAENTTGKVRSLNLLENKWEFIGEAGKGKQLAIATVRHSLFLLNNDGLLKLEKDKSWKKLETVQHRPDVWVKVVTAKGCIFVLERDKLLCYDVAQNVWYDDLVSGCLDVGFCATASSRFIYTMGGISKGRIAKKYDIVLEEWEDMPMMKTGRSDAAAAILHGVLYVLGGWWKNKALSSVEHFELQGGVWTKVTSMNIHRHGFSACAANDKIYAVGGDFTLDEGANDQTQTIEVFEDGDRTWTVVQQLDSSESPCNARAYMVHRE